MSNPTRIDAEQLFVTIGIDPETSNAVVKTNIHDPAVMLRVIGQAMSVWADDIMRKRIEAAQSAQSRIHVPSMMPLRKM